MMRHLPFQVRLTTLPKLLPGGGLGQTPTGNPPPLSSHLVNQQLTPPLRQQLLPLNLSITRPPLLLLQVRTLTHFNSVFFFLVFLIKTIALFVFLKSDHKQNARSLLTPVSDPAFHARSHGILSFALHGSFLNHFLIGGNSSRANQII